MSTKSKALLPATDETQKSFPMPFNIYRRQPSQEDWTISIGHARPTASSLSNIFIKCPGGDSQSPDEMKEHSSGIPRWEYWMCLRRAPSAAADESAISKSLSLSLGICRDFLNNWSTPQNKKTYRQLYKNRFHDTIAVVVVVLISDFILYWQFSFRQDHFSCFLCIPTHRLCVWTITAAATWMTSQQAQVQVYQRDSCRPVRIKRSCCVIKTILVGCDVLVVFYLNGGLERGMWSHRPISLSFSTMPSGNTW